MAKPIENTIQTNLICENPAYRQHIINTALKNNKSKIFEDFVQNFYSYLPVDYMEANKTDFFALIAEESFAFWQKRKLDEDKIGFLKNSKEKFSGSVLQIVTNDRSFIVDSVKYLLQKHDINIKFCLHPTISVKRSENGEAIEISLNNSDESIMFVVVNEVSEQMQEIVIEECRKIFSKGVISNKSNTILLNKLNKIIENGSRTDDDIKFLTWVEEHNFTFLASLDFDINANISNLVGDISIFENDIDFIKDIIKKAIASKGNDLLLGKMNQISELNSGRYIDYILVSNENSSTIFFGFYTRSLHSQSVQNIPVLSNKLHYVLARSGFKKDGYNYRKLLSIAEAFPRDALFQIDNSDFYCMCVHILSAMMAKTLKLLIQKDSSGEFLNVLVFMPIERLTPETHVAIIKYLSSKFDTKVITDEITDVSRNFCYLYVTLGIKETVSEFSSSEIEQSLNNITAEWDSAFMDALADAGIEPNILVHENIFSREYQYRFSPKDGINDYLYLQRLNNNIHEVFNLQKISENNYTIKIYSDHRVILSDILPLIEHFGFKALNQHTFIILNGPKTQYLSEFSLLTSAEIKFPFNGIKDNVEDALHYMSIGEFKHNILCNLILVSGLKWQQIKILKAITAYLGQIGFTYGREYVQMIMVKHSNFSELLIKLFEAKFSPNAISDADLDSINTALSSYLNNVTNAVEDKILRTLQDVIEAITRTNCYQLVDNKRKRYLSFKFDSSKVPELPLPLPYAEIFVYCDDFEGIHLRGGKVARGGIRWSDRKEDYRTEALGLMKAQMTKNSVIVPVGSKGAFYVNLDPCLIDKANYFAKVIECYKNFLRGLLDITDNIIDGKVIHPENVRIYDNDDPYLVVAADKGTASFSDYANSVSNEYNFWLGDAFASGGSAGYDHKKMAITAKGAWISVTRHFSEIGIDIQNDPVTVVGIGDMSGDVFGNGMLLSKSLKLVAAFNRDHIFIDPNPDALRSFTERKRLFEMPGSKWSDYNISLISHGGGVFERSAKKITISDEAKKILDTNIDEATPENLINIILKAPVDLIWNGGIGTYVKASSENNLEIGDKTNDLLRCNGNQLRAKVVGEGGNLGFSQKGRIEYAQNGGGINTDFIDNSAGVDCSDHEVNIKIAFGLAIKSKTISIEERNILLADMSSEVEKLVLQDNFKQTSALTIAEHSPAYNIGMFAHLLNALEAEGLLSREVEFLPSDDEISRMSAANEKMTRPELAVLMSYSKMSVYRELLKSNIANDPASTEFLIGYFPPIMRVKFKNEILSHPLRKEIILTSITNKIINELGSPIIKHIQSETGAELSSIIRSYMILNKVFDIDNLWKKAEDLSGSISLEIQVDIFSEIIKLLRRGICWFIRNLQEPIEIAKEIEFYGERVQKLCLQLNKFLLGEAKFKLEERIAHYTNCHVPENFAQNISVLDCGISTLDILLVASSSKIDTDKVAELYFKVADYFSIDWMRKSVEKQITDSYWNRLSMQALKDDLYDKQRRILQKIIENESNIVDLEKWVEKHSQYVTIFTGFIEKLKLQENIDLNMMILANKQFEMFLRKV